MKKQWAKSSRWRKSWNRCYYKEDVRNLLRLDKLLRNKPPFKEVFLDDLLFFEGICLEFKMNHELSKPSPWLNLVTNNLYGKSW